MNSLSTARSNRARILAAITFHFDPNRLQFLAEVLRSLSEFPVAGMDVVILTNIVGEQELTLLRRLGAELLPGKTFSVRHRGNLSHPHNLAWCHKEIIAREFVSENTSGRYSHFVYLEDDMRLSFANFCYFVEFREILFASGMLPAFLRVEYDPKSVAFVNTDNTKPIYPNTLPCLELENYLLINMPNPYCACFILDAELAAEYIRSRSFDFEASRQVRGWNIRERAAMGLCFENVPPPFECRYVVPVSKDTDTAPSFAWITHLPNNYADDPETLLGKIHMDALFAGTKRCQKQRSTPQNLSENQCLTTNLDLKGGQKEAQHGSQS